MTTTTIYETVTIDLLPEEMDHLRADRRAAHQEIGKLAIVKSRINERIKHRTQGAEKEAERCTLTLKRGKHEVCCRVELDYHEGVARLYREDNGTFVRPRKITKEERQRPLDFDMAPATSATFDVASGKRLRDAVKAIREPEDGTILESHGFGERTPAEEAADAVRLDKMADVASKLVLEFGEIEASKIIDEVREGRLPEDAIGDARKRLASSPKAFAAQRERASAAADAILGEKPKGKKSKANGAARA